jgi:dipeptidyl aminopeptidase/acylaminoacyl peptidase
MKKLPIYLMILSLLASCTDTKEVKDTVTQHYTIEQFMNNLSVFGGSFSPDESKILVSSDQTGIFNAYTVDIDGKSDLQTLTNSDDESIFVISFFPEDNRVLYRSDDNGNEIFHIYVRNEDGTTQELTPGENARAVFYGWAHDGKSFFYGSNQRNPQLMDVYEMKINNFESEMIYQNDKALGYGGISDDKNYLALTKPINTNDNHLYLYDRGTGEMTEISEEQAAYNPADFAKDNKALYYTTDVGSEFAYLVKYEFETGEKTKILEESWDIWYAYYSHNGKYRIVGINEDGKTVVKVTDVATGEPVDFPQFANGDITSVNISRSENKVSFYLGSSASPSNLYVYDFETEKHIQLTNTLNPEINEKDLVTAEVVRFKSFDGVEIPGIFYKPKGASADNQVPAIVQVHGGPGGQSRQSYSPLTQYLVNHGYAVYAVNNRGSSGYGKTFYKMDNRQHGEGDLMDCVKAKDYMATLEYIDGEKIGIMGGSYGGFMTMAALTSQPEEFEVGVNLYGVTNWLRTLNSIPPWWESFKDALYEEMGDPATDSVRLHRISPLFHADKIVKPVMVLQGAQDPRVLQAESDEIVEAARQNNVPVEYVLFPDEGHGFVKKENRIEAYGKILKFLDKYLKKEELKG